MLYLAFAFAAFHRGGTKLISYNHIARWMLIFTESLSVCSNRSNDCLAVKFIPQVIVKMPLDFKAIQI